MNLNGIAMNNLSKQDILDLINERAFDFHEAEITGIITMKMIRNMGGYYGDILSGLEIHTPITTVLGDVITYEKKYGNTSSVQINGKVMRYESMNDVSGSMGNKN